jgi:hypothetical protein
MDGLIVLLLERASVPEPAIHLLFKLRAVPNESIYLVNSRELYEEYVKTAVRDITHRSYCSELRAYFGNVLGTNDVTWEINVIKAMYVVACTVELNFSKERMVLNNTIEMVDNETRNWILESRPKDIAVILEGAKTVSSTDCALPVERGQIGEAIIVDLLKPVFETVENVAKQNRIGDIIVNHIIMLEVKNYQGTVPTTQVEKFERDFREHPEMVGGVFISRSTNIAKKATIDVSFDRHRPIIYLSNVSDNVIISSVKLLIHRSQPYWFSIFRKRRRNAVRRECIATMTKYISDHSVRRKDDCLSAIKML